MDFQYMQKIENPDFYLDVAFSRAKKKAEAYKTKASSKRKDSLKLAKELELLRLETIRNVLYYAFDKIMKSFPNFSELPEFYFELVKVTIEYDRLKKSLGGMKWARDKTDFFYKDFSFKIRRNRNAQRIEQYRKEFYGRISSVVKQVKKELEFLESARKVMRNYPIIKEGFKTVAIAGFPNVGKTTLLSKLTGSSPEIASYPFTTRSLNLGYAVIKGEKVQFIDTPGTLNRFDKMNNTEKQAHLAMQLVADDIIYIFDLTEPYPLEDQEKLLENIKKLGKKITIYLSKTDILDSEKAKKFLKKHHALGGPEEIMAKL